MATVEVFLIKLTTWLVNGGKIVRTAWGRDDDTHGYQRRWSLRQGRFGLTFRSHLNTCTDNLRDIGSLCGAPHKDGCQWNRDHERWPSVKIEVQRLTTGKARCILEDFDINTWDATKNLVGGELTPWPKMSPRRRATIKAPIEIPKGIEGNLWQIVPKLASPTFKRRTSRFS